MMMPDSIQPSVLETFHRLVGNATKLRKDTLHTAIALSIAESARIPGRMWTSICCWCIDRKYGRTGDVPAELCARVSEFDHHPCMTCPEMGRDVLVASVPCHEHIIP